MTFKIGGMQTVPETFLSVASTRMRLSKGDIARCLVLLSEEQMWHRGGDHENSIANLLLHLEGNIRQWILHGVDNQPDVRERDDEFSLTPTMTAAEAYARFEATVEQACEVIAGLDPGRLLEMTDPQPNGTWPACTILQAIFHVAGHLQTHTGQIILLTKQFARRDLDMSMPRKR